MRKMRLDTRSCFPSGMETYLEFNGWHFNKKMCEWATSHMYKINGQQKQKIMPYTYEQVQKMITDSKLSIDISYDVIYLANYVKSDFLNSSITDETHLVLFIKDYLEDPDSYEGKTFTRFYADCIGKGISIPWEDLI